MLLKGQIAIITGGASKRGLGLAIARLFADHGAHIAILDLDLAAAQEAIAALHGDGHLAIACDVTVRRQCDAAVEGVLQRYGRVDILVNNAGITSPQRVMQVDDATYDRVFDINMRGTLHMTQAVVPAMQAQKSGSIVNMSSVSAQRGGGVFGGSHYSAAKGAILGYTKACARELGPDNIRVNAICPSMIDTDITGGALTEERRADIRKTIPMGRIGEAHEVAGCALFLASSLASYVTGSEIDINGGSHIH
ncbi:FabG Dehydrogenases with different specificities (related to short-chain alcohol dehydrogenases) [Rhabdaerophilaceae bacterium]